MPSRTKTIGPIAASALALAAAPALAVPGGEHGKPDKPAKPDKPGKGVAYVFKGAYVGDDTTVDVDHTNKHARAFAGPVTFDFSAAKLSVGDSNVSGAPDLDDVADGDRVVVKAKLPKSDPGPQPFAANQLVDQTNPAPEEAETP